MEGLAQFHEEEEDECGLRLLNDRMKMRIWKRLKDGFGVGDGRSLLFRAFWGLFKLNIIIIIYEYEYEYKYNCMYVGI